MKFEDWRELGVAGRCRARCVEYHDETSATDFALLLGEAMSRHKLSCRMNQPQLLKTRHRPSQQLLAKNKLWCLPSMKEASQLQLPRRSAKRLTYRY